MLRKYIVSLLLVCSSTTYAELDDCKQESVAKINYNRDCFSYLMAVAGIDESLTGKKSSSDIESKITKYCSCLSTKAPVHRFAEKNCKYLSHEIKDSITAEGAIRLCGPHPK